MTLYQVKVGGKPTLKTVVRAQNEKFACAIMVNRLGTSVSKDTLISAKTSVKVVSKKAKEFSTTVEEINNILSVLKPSTKKVITNPNIDDLAYKDYPHYSQDPLGSVGRNKHEDKRKSFINGFNACKEYYNIK